MRSYGALFFWKYRYIHTENFFPNLIKWTQNQIVFTIFRLIWNQMDVRLVPNYLVPLAVPNKSEYCTEYCSVLWLYCCGVVLRARKLAVRSASSATTVLRLQQNSLGDTNSSRHHVGSEGPLTPSYITAVWCSGGFRGPQLREKTKEENKNGGRSKIPVPD